MQFSIISNCSVYFYYAQNIEENMNVCPLTPLGKVKNKTT